MSSIIPFTGSALSTVIAPADAALIQRGAALIDPNDAGIRSWVEERRGDFENINALAERSLKVESALTSARDQVGVATAQLKKVESDRLKLDGEVRKEQETFTEARSGLQDRLRSADSLLQNRKQMRLVSLPNPLYSELGMRYGPHALTATAPVVAYLFADQIKEACSEALMSLDCTGTVTQMNLILPLVIAGVASYMFTRAAEDSKNLISAKSRLQTQLSSCEETHRQKVEAFDARRDRSELEHKEGISSLDHSKSQMEQLDKTRGELQVQIDGTRAKIIGDVYKRNLEGIQEGLEELEKGPNEFVKKTVVRSVQSAIDLVITKFAGTAEALRIEAPESKSRLEGPPGSGEE